MRTIISAVLMLLSTTALATNPPPKAPSAEAHAAAVGIQGQAQGQEQSQTASSDQEQSQSANNEGNSQQTHITSNYKGVRNAPSVALGSVYPTAGCQGGFGIGGSGVNGSGLLNFSFTKKECETVVLAQNFAALGMPETSCDILKTTKAWKRAVKANPEIAAVCDPQPEATSDAAPPQSPEIDMSNYVKREELEERDRRMIQKFTNK